MQGMKSAQKTRASQRRDHQWLSSATLDVLEEYGAPSDMIDEISSGSAINRYIDDQELKTRLADEGHRAIVGGRWDDIGRLQHDFLLDQGLVATDRLLDIGAGAFRGGVRFAATLSPGHYFAIDRSADLLDTGYAAEIVPAGLEERFPRRNFAAVEDFRPSFGVTFDVALAVSVFTHLPIAYLETCLRNLRPQMKRGGRFFVTVFEGPPDTAVERPDGIITYPDRDPFHHARHDLLGLGKGDWAAVWLGAWGHPRDQQMVVFVAV
jgi:hypothetical protein